MAKIIISNKVSAIPSPRLSKKELRAFHKICKALEETQQFSLTENQAEILRNALNRH